MRTRVVILALGYSLLIVPIASSQFPRSEPQQVPALPPNSPVTAIQTRNKPQTAVYDVTDLVHKSLKLPGATTQESTPRANATLLMKLIVSTTRHETWERGGGKGKIEFIPESDCLCVTNSPEVLDEVKKLLDGMRWMHDQKVVVVVKVYEVPVGVGARLSLRTKLETRCLNADEARDTLVELNRDPTVKIHAQSRLTVLDGQTAHFEMPYPRLPQQIFDKVSLGRGVRIETDIAWADAQVAAATAEEQSILERDRLLDAARQRYEKALTAAPRNKSAILGLAYLHEKSGDQTRSVVLYQAVMKSYPNDHDIPYRMAKMLARFEDWPGAIDACLMALNLDPNNRTYMQTLGYCQARNNQWETAFGNLQKIMSEAEARYFLGRVLLDLNRTNDAQQQFELALKADPRDTDSVQMLTDLKQGVRPQNASKPAPSDSKPHGQILSEKAEVQVGGALVSCTPTISVNGKSVVLNLRTSLVKPGAGKVTGLETFDSTLNIVIPDGQTLVTHLGSCQANEIVTRATSELSSIPYLGRLFKNARIEKSVRSELYQVVTVRVLN